MVLLNLLLVLCHFACNVEVTNTDGYENIFILTKIMMHSKSTDSHRRYGVGICQCGLQGRADCSTGTVGERTARKYTGAGQHSHKVSGFMNN